MHCLTDASVFKTPVGGCARPTHSPSRTRALKTRRLPTRQTHTERWKRALRLVEWVSDTTTTKKSMPGDREPDAIKLYPKNVFHSSKPLFLHPTPNTLHPTPYTLHSTPYTLNTTPYTRHPKPSLCVSSFLSPYSPLSSLDLSDTQSPCALSTSPPRNRCAFL